MLLDNKAAPDAGDGKGVTPLMQAASLGEDKIATALLDKGANVNARAKGDVTPLMFASLTGQVAIVKLFLERGAQVDARDEQGRSALFDAGRPGISRHHSPSAREGRRSARRPTSSRRPRRTMRSKPTRCPWSSS